jgi:hypothetical protein
MQNAKLKKSFSLKITLKKNFEKKYQLLEKLKILDLIPNYGHLIFSFRI